MKVKDILKALEGAPADAGVLLSVRAIKVVTPPQKVATSGKKENPKPIVVKKPASKAAKPTAKPLAKPVAKKATAVKPVAKKPTVAKKTSGKK